MMRTLQDFPEFIVTDIRDEGPITNGYNNYTLVGTFTSRNGVRLGRGWLILPNLRGLIGDLEELNQDTLRGVFTTMYDALPCEVGTSLVLIDGYWDAELIKSVLQPEWEWQKVVFSPSDAVACRYENIELVDASNKGGSVWRKISQEELRVGRPILSEPYRGQRYVGEPWIVKGGWDHEHCKICMGHIDSGDTAYIDPDDRWWFCKKCGEEYVLPHDLSFVAPS
jgi:hypothetical protein